MLIFCEDPRKFELSESITKIRFLSRWLEPEEMFVCRAIGCYEKSLNASPALAVLAVRLK